MNWLTKQVRCYCLHGLQRPILILKKEGQMRKKNHAFVDKLAQDSIQTLSNYERIDLNDSWLPTQVFGKTNATILYLSRHKKVYYLERRHQKF